MTTSVLEAPAPRAARMPATTAVTAVSALGATAPHVDPAGLNTTDLDVAGLDTSSPEATAGPDHGGWAELMREHREDLVRIARMRLRNDVSGSDAEDVVHEVFLRVVRIDLDLQALSRPVAYLRRAVANECATRWRRHRELAVEETPDAGERDHADPCAAALTVRDALEEVSPRQRAVIVMGFLQGYTDAEIAATLGIEPVTVRTLRRRGLERLRTVLGTNGEGHPGRQSTPAAARSTVRSARSTRSARSDQPATQQGRRPVEAAPDSAMAPATGLVSVSDDGSDDTAGSTANAATVSTGSAVSAANHDIAASQDTDEQRGGRITRRVPSVRSLHGSSRYSLVRDSARPVPPVPVVVPIAQLPDRSRIPA